MLEERDISYVINAHQNHTKEPKRPFRLWDGRTPYWIHPLWCATTILTETTLHEEIRRSGAVALLYHDVREDTRLTLPPWLNDEVVSMIDEMTFFGQFDQEETLISSKPQVIRLLKLYDKVNNLMDCTWMDAGMQKKYTDSTYRLMADVKRNYGFLNIVKIALNL